VTMSKSERDRITDERLAELVAAGAAAADGNVFTVADVTTRDLGEMAGEVLAARRWRPPARPDHQTPEHAGHDGGWRSGPLRATVQISSRSLRVRLGGDPAESQSGTAGHFTLCMYWRARGGPDGDQVLWVDFELFEVVRPGTYRSRDRSRGETTRLGEAELAASGFVKWDGCTQFELGPVHVDGAAELDRLLWAVAEARRRCALAMPGTDAAAEYE